MLYGKTDRKKQDRIESACGLRTEQEALPKYRLNQSPIEPDAAYQLIKDTLLDEGNARLNLATFCQTYMEPEAVKLMRETLEKNAIDKSEYPRTAELENRCVSILAELWGADETYIGTSTVGSSEACMLGGLAMKFAWRERLRAKGKDPAGRQPNLVISSGYQVCWEKFCTYWDVELRAVPMTRDCLSLDLTRVMDYVDENTIGIVGILGITYTGCYDDIQGLDRLVEDYNRTHDTPVYIHVDGASGGLYTPFADDPAVWDFRLKNVVSINTSGHKYGLVYPGVGWVVWRSRAYLPEKLIFKVSYLGGELPTIAINFSHSASQIIGQYYNFLRLGFDGYRAIQSRTHKVAAYLGRQIGALGEFQIINDGSRLPIVCYTLKDDPDRMWDLYDLADRLMMKGWQVPAYPMPKDIDDIIVQRIVVRADLGMNLAEEFLEDLGTAIEDLKQAKLIFHKPSEKKAYGFTH